FPPAGGLRVIQVVLPPGAGVTEHYDATAFRAEWSQAMAASSSAPAPSPPAVATVQASRPAPATRVREHQAGGLHATNSVDLGLVMSGETDLELDDQQAVTLRAGDVLDQNVTRHA